MKILDLSAGNRAVWFDKRYRDALFVDIRPQVAPDLIADSMALPLADNAGYDLVVFDPPHVNGGKNGNISRDYGHHTSAQIRALIAATAGEAHRVTRADALLALKWNDHDQPLAKILALLTQFWEPLVGTTTAIGTTRRSVTRWILLRRRDHA